MAQPTTLSGKKREGFGWELLKEAFSPMVDAGRAVAETIGTAAAPSPGSPGAKAVAGIRSVLPGGQSYDAELERYNQAATPAGHSVLDTAKSLPGEQGFDAMRRWASSPLVEQQMMQTASMAAPIAVHASPNKWAGRPLDSARGTGEGGAAYGEGHYATVPSNAKGIDQRYREQGLADWTVSPAEGKSAVIERLRRFAMGEQDKYVRSGMVRPQPGDPMSIAPEAYPALKQADFLENSYQGTLEPWEARDMVRRYTNGTQHVDDLVRAPDRGSFHVWDVPDTLMDYDAPLSGQTQGVLDALRPNVGDEVVHDAQGWGKLAPEGVSRSRPARLGNETVRWIEGGPDEAMAEFMATPGHGIIRGDSERGRLLASKGVQGHTYAGEAGSARTSGIEGDVPNFVIYRGEDITPLGTFGSAEEWLASDLRKRLQPRIDAEEALRASGKATPEAYAELRRRFSPEAAPAAPDTSHQTGHRPAGADNGAPLSDLTGNGRIYPDDVYSADGRRIYGTGQPGEDAVFRMAQRLRGKPEAEITVYRAVPTSVKSNEILPGDWVALTPDYARLHGDGPLRGDYRVISKKVRAGDIFTSGDSIHEWGYSPPAPAAPAAPAKSATDYKSMTEQLRAAHPDVEFSLMPGGGGSVVLSSIKVPKEMRGQGVGDAFMSDLVRLADEGGVRLAASPSSDFGGVKSRIREWNKRHGFVDNKGRAKDFTLSETMYRDPKKP